MANVYEKGYALFRDVVPLDLIDEFLEEFFRVVLPSKDKFFRQSSGSFEIHRKNRFGHMANPLSELHNYHHPKYKRFSDLAKKIYMHPNVKMALIEASTYPKLKLMGSMLFQANINTHPHQDNYYLDSVPNGKLLGGWFALEDIAVAAGQFYVVEGSQKEKFNLNAQESVTSLKYVEKMKKYLADNQHRLVIPDLKKGDFFIWTSEAVHGSTKTLDENLTRLSLTAHYIPQECEFGNSRGEVRKVSYGAFEGWQFKSSTPEYSWAAQRSRELQIFMINKTPAVYKRVKQVYRFLQNRL